MAWRLRANKEEFVKDFKGKIKDAGRFILTDYKGLSVKEITELRRKVRESGFEFKVIKNTLMKLVLDNLKIEGMKDNLKGTTAIVVGDSELNDGAKILFDFSKKHDSIKIKAGYLDGDVLSAEQVTTLAKLPSREVLLSMLCRAMNGPITGIATGLNGIIRALATALDAVSKKKEK